MFLVPLVVLMSLLGIQAQVLFLKSCPSQDVVQNFDVERYTGIWYENRKYFNIYQPVGACTTATYSLTTDSTVVKVVNAGTVLSKTISINGTATITEPSNNEAKLAVAFNGAAQETSNYWVLDTDYDTYAVVWFCENRLNSLVNTQMMWILTRERFPSSATIKKARKIVKDRGLNWRKLKVTPQRKTCPAAPEPEIP